MESKGIILLGEAANAYVTLKYIESAIGTLFICVFCYGIWKFFKWAMNNRVI